MLALLLPIVLAQAPAPKPATMEAKWGEKIAALEAKLKSHPPKEGGVMFAGSSTMVLWDLKKYFPEKDYANVGFGGSKIAECVHFAPRILQPFKPGTVVFSCGGNDLAAGVSPEQVAKDFEAFVAAVRKTSPSCRVIVFSLKPTLKRVALYEKETRTNALIKAFCAKDDRLTYLDVNPELLGPDGKPKREMLKDDLLHPNPAAYEMMAAKLKAELAK